MEYGAVINDTIIFNPVFGSFHITMELQKGRCFTPPFQDGHGPTMINLSMQL